MEREFPGYGSDEWEGQAMTSDSNMSTPAKQPAAARAGGMSPYALRTAPTATREAREGTTTPPPQGSKILGLLSPVQSHIQCFGGLHNNYPKNTVGLSTVGTMPQGQRTVVPCSLNLLIPSQVGYMCT